MSLCHQYEGKGVIVFKMAKIAYILLCHKDPDGVIAQAQGLTAAGDYLAIHFDARAPRENYDRLVEALGENPLVRFTSRRIKCDWGSWSLVAATLLAVRAALDGFPGATHFYMLSGDCMPIKTAQFAHDFLDRQDVDFIESVDFFGSDWIKTGMKEERLIYRHFFNERTHKTLFYKALAVQRRLGLVRKVPADIQMQIGSQWWCLRRRTIETVLDFIDSRRDVMRFFRRTWIPDETFFQTLVRHLVPEVQINSRTLTFLMFSDYGMPVTFYNDHYDLLVSQDYLFARKISPDAGSLKERLGKLYVAQNVQFSISNEGRNLFAFLTDRGRVGRRFAPRFWETESSLGRERTLMMVTCKKWHVAKRLIDLIRRTTSLPAVAYLFNEAETELPDLGGIQSTIAKRTRHCRAIVRMLFDYWKTDALVFCIDPANVDLMQDFYNNKCTVKLLEIECDFTDDYLIGHAKRVGLASDHSPRETIDRLLPTIRYDVSFESDRIRDAGFANFIRIRQSATPEENAVHLAGFLGIPADIARKITATEYLYLD
jgi:hypothetical protein